MDYRRQEHWNDCLDAVIEKQLEALPNWTWIAAADETQWLGTYEKLKTWLAKNSNKYPKQNSDHATEKQLAKWLSNQREAWKARRLNENQKQKLETLPGWNQDEKKAVWFEKCTAVLDFKIANEGKLPNHHAVDPWERSLGVWVKNQKQNLSNFSKEQRREWKKLAIPFI